MVNRKCLSRARVKNIFRLLYFIWCDTRHTRDNQRVQPYSHNTSHYYVNDRQKKKKAKKTVYLFQYKRQVEYEWVILLCMGCGLCAKHDRVWTRWIMNQKKKKFLFRVCCRIWVLYWLRIFVFCIFFSSWDMMKSKLIVNAFCYTPFEWIFVMHLCQRKTFRMIFSWWKTKPNRWRWCTSTHTHTHTPHTSLIRDSRPLERLQ